MLFTNRLRRGTVAAGAALCLAGTLLAVPSPAQAAIGDDYLNGVTEWTLWQEGTDPAGGALGWTQNDYDDSAWETGAHGAMGVEPQAPVINTPWVKDHEGGGSKETFFLRTDVELTAADLEGVTAFEASTRIDDGIVVYVNGVEAFRSWTVEDQDFTQNHSQYSDGQTSDMERTEFRLDASLFHEGSNTIAVSVHNRSSGSSDIYFAWDKLVSTDQLPPVPPTITELGLNIGATESEVNFAWFSTYEGAEQVQFAPASAVTAGEFPADATIVDAIKGGNHEGTFAAEATVTGLAENTTYAYRVGSEEGGWSDIYQYSTETFDDEFNFLFYADAQIGSSGDVESDSQGWTNTLSASNKLFPESSFLISLGDQVNTASSSAEYDGFFAPDTIREVPLAVNDGNHDVGGTAYDEHFTMPNEENRNYWFTHNNVLVVAIDSNRNSDTDIAEHAEYLREVVAAQGENADWVIVTYHHSAFSQANHLDDSSVIRLRQQLSPVLSELNVDLVLSGHDHIHTRTHLMEGDVPVTAEDPATGDVFAPEDGQVMYLTGNSSSGSKFYSYYEPGVDINGLVPIGDQPYTAFWNQDYSPDFSNIEVTPTELKVTTYNANGLQVIDEFTLTQEADDAETPGEETPGEETPGEETPGEETPGEETPGEETPGEETPGEETPAEASVELGQTSFTQAESANGVDYTGTNFGEGNVRIELVHPDNSVTVIEDAAEVIDGAFNGTIVYGVDGQGGTEMPAGAYTIRFIQGETVVEVGFAVTGEDAQQPGDDANDDQTGDTNDEFSGKDHEGGLAQTGANELLMFSGAAALLALAGAGVLVARNRSQKA